MIRLLYNGTEIKHGVITIITGDDKSEPPKDDRPPARDVPKPEAPTKGFGLITKGFNSRQLTLKRGEVFSSEFKLPIATSADRMTFTFAMQNGDGADVRLWVSKKPGGSALKSWWMRVANAVGKNLVRGSQIGVAVAVRGGRLERKYAAVEPGTIYYFNAQLKKGPATAKVLLTLDGNF